MDTRHCARPGCGAPAMAMLTYEYATRTVWLDRPGEEPSPGSTWGLCGPHADGLRVPVGWACNDRRPPGAPVCPPVAV